jgi:hypothetical protein
MNITEAVSQLPDIIVELPVFMFLTLLLFSSIGFIKFCEIFVVCIFKLKKLCKYKDNFKNKSNDNKSKSTNDSTNDLMNGVNYII